MRTIRRCIYALGLRPKAGSIWYSPSLALNYAARGAMRDVKRYLEEAQRSGKLIRWGKE